MLHLRSLLVICVLLGPGAAAAATFDLSGEWSYTISVLTVSGGCPKGEGSSGALEIIQSGESFTLVLSTGAVCSPPAACTFTGTVSGAEYTGSNTMVVDNEGGTVTNTLTFTATSTAAASGEGTSVYQHPDMTCTWTQTIEMTRVAPDGGGGIPGPDGGATGGDARTEAKDSGCSVASRAPLTGLLMLIPILFARWRRRGCSLRARTASRHDTLT